MRLDVAGSGRLTEHFTLSEFCHKGRQIYLDERFFTLVRILERFRVWYNRPINVTSGYRPPAYNKKIGGSSNSSHLFSGAVDFPLPKEYQAMSSERKEEFLQNVKTRWRALCAQEGVFPQVNFYDTYLHLGISLRKSSFLDKRTKK